MQDVAVEAAPPVDTLGAVVMNDSVWRADTAKIWTAWENMWTWINNGETDSISLHAKEFQRLSESLIEFRYDSSLFEMYAYSNNFIGIGLAEEGRLEEGYNKFCKAFQMISEKFGENHIRNTEICVYLSHYYLNRGDLEQTIKWQKKALSICKNLFPDGRHPYFYNILSNIGFYYSRMGDYKNSLSYYSLLQKQDGFFSGLPKNDVRPPMWMAYCYVDLGQYEDAIDCINLVKEICPDNLKLFLHLNCGKLYLRMGDLKLARHHLLYAQRLSSEIPVNSYGLLESSVGLGDVEKMEKNWNDALGQYERALGLTSNSTERRDVLDKLAKTYLDMGNFDFCLSKYEELLHEILPQFNPENYLINPTLEEFNGDFQLVPVLKNKADAIRAYYDSTRRPELLEAAANTYALAADFADKLRLGYKWQSSKQSLSERVLPIFEGAIATAFEMYNMTGDGKYKEKAFALAERSKAFTLLENLRNDDARSHSGISPELFDREEKVNQDIAMYERFILEEEHNAENPDSSKIYYWNGKLVDLKKAQDSLTSVLEQNYPEYYRLKYENPIASTGQIQQKLRSGETLIEYFLGDSTLFTFTVNNAGLNYHQQQIDSTFFNAVNRLRHFANTPSRGAAWTTDYRQFTAGSRFLYRALLEPVLSANDQTSLIIVPDGILGYLPFNLLLMGEPDPVTLADYSYRGLPYLVSNHDIRYEYSATLLLESQKMRSKVKDWLPWNNEPAYCGFAPSYGDSEAIASRGEEDSLKLAELYTGLVRGKLGALSFTQPEIEEASATMEGKAFEAEAATEAEFKRQASQANILHLAMHALTNDKEPLFSQLVFTRDDGDTIEDGRLHAYELQNMKLKADLAVLSACNTGAGKLQRGEGVMSLSRAFKFAGCPNVVMSLWQADDLSTKTIVTDFFKKLKSGMGKDQALCQAQRDFLTRIADQNLTHPYYWSALMLIGDGEPVQNHLPWWVIAASLLIFLGIVVAVSRILARKNYLSRSI